MICKISANPENPPLSPFSKGGGSSFSKRDIPQKSLKNQIFLLFCKVVYKFTHYPELSDE